MMMMTCATIVCILQIQMWKLLWQLLLLLQTWLGCSCRNQLHFMLRLPLTTFAAQACVRVRVCVGVYLITLARAHILFGPLCPHLAWPGLSVCLSVPQAAIVDSTDKTKNILAALFLPHFVLSILIICLWLRSFCLPLANCSANYLDLKVRSSHSPLTCSTPLNVFVPHALAHCNFFRVVQSFPQRKQVKFPRGKKWKPKNWRAMQGVLWVCVLAD